MLQFLVGNLTTVGLIFTLLVSNPFLLIITRIPFGF